MTSDVDNGPGWTSEAIRPDVGRHRFPEWKISVLKSEVVILVRQER